MKWRTPRCGDRRVVRRFAWLPVRLSAGRTIWLELYWSHQELVPVPGEFGKRLEWVSEANTIGFRADRTDP